MELCRFYAQLHDCVPSSLRRVDRVHVGLHGGGVQGLCSLLPGNCGHWKPCGKITNPTDVTFHPSIQEL
jgi:hypothetical protein